MLENISFKQEEFVALTENNYFKEFPVPDTRFFQPSQRLTTKLKSINL